MRRKLTRYLALLRGLALLSCLLLCAGAQALDVHGSYYPLGEELEYLVDPGGQLELGQILANPDQYRFQPSAEGTPSSSYDPIWLRLKLDFRGSAKGHRYILFSMVENMFDIRIYRPDASGVYQEWVTGNDHPASSRELDATHYGFALEGSRGEMTVYLRTIGGPGSNNFPWVLVEDDTYRGDVSDYINLNLICLTALGTLFFFNLCLAISLGKPSYMYYSVYLFSVIMALLTVDGIAFYYLWPDTPALNERAMHSFNLLSAGARLLTITSFLGMASVAPRLHRVSVAVLILLGIAFITVNIVGIKGLPPFAVTYVWAVAILTGFVVCGLAIKLKVRMAALLFLVLFLPSIGALVQGLLTINNVGHTAIILQLSKFSFVIHVLLFSLCLATQMKSETESRMRAMHDNLTGLPGTTLLREHFELAAKLARRKSWQMAVFFIDLDGFKAVNDTQGHDVGDKLLIEVSTRLQAELRQADTVARIGGDEFVVLLTEVADSSASALVAEKLLATVAAPYRIAAAEVKISASIGIAMYPGVGVDLPTLLKEADTAMYSAKHSGKNAYAFAQEVPTASTDESGSSWPVGQASAQVAN